VLEPVTPKAPEMRPRIVPYLINWSRFSKCRTMQPAE
jgi:hypothetical protein